MIPFGDPATIRYFQLADQRNGGAGASGSSSSSSSGSTTTTGGELVRRADNPYIDDLIQQVSDDATQAFRRGNLPNIRSDAINAGQFGSTRHGIVEGIASGDLAKQIATTAAELRYRDWEQQQQRRAEEYAAQMAASAAFGGAGYTGGGSSMQDIALQRELAQQSNALQAMNMMGQFMNMGMGNSMNAYGMVTNPFMSALQGGSQLQQSGMLGGLGAMNPLLGMPGSMMGQLYGMGQGFQGLGENNAQRAIGLSQYNAGLNAADMTLLGQLLASMDPGRFATTHQYGIGTATQPYSGPSPFQAGIGGAASAAGLLHQFMPQLGQQQSYGVQQYPSQAYSGIPSWMQGGGGGYTGGF